MAARHQTASSDPTEAAVLSRLVPGPSLLRQVAVVGAVMVALFVLVVAPQESFRRSYNDWRHTRTLEGQLRQVDEPPGDAARPLCRRLDETSRTCQRSMAATVALGDGRVLVWGGEFATADSGGIYDPATSAWERLPIAPGPTRYRAATAWTGQEALIWGGHANVSGLRLDAGGVAFNPATRTWRELPAAPVGLVDARATALDGGVLIAGGETRSYPSRPTSMWLDLATGTWTLVPAPVNVVNVARDGKRLLATGPMALHPADQTTWWPSRSNAREASGWPVVAFDPARMAWEPVADPLATRWMALAVGGDGTLTAVTAADLNEPLRAYELRGGAWHQVAETLKGGPPVLLFEVVSHPPIALWTGRLLLMGGHFGLTSWDPTARRFATTKLLVLNHEGNADWSGSAVVALSNRSPAGWVWTPEPP